MDLQIGDIVFFKRKNFFASLVSRITKSPYSHVAMVIYPGYMIEANWYKKSNIVAFEYNPEYMEAFRIKGGLSHSQQMIVLNKSGKQLGKTYDYPQLFEYVLEYLFKARFFDSFLNSKNLIICSELIDDIYDEISIDLVPDRAKGNVTPADLVNSDLIERLL